MSEVIGKVDVAEAAVQGGCAVEGSARVRARRIKAMGGSSEAGETEEVGVRGRRSAVDGENGGSEASMQGEAWEAC